MKGFALLCLWVLSLARGERESHEDEIVLQALVNLTRIQSRIASSLASPLQINALCPAPPLASTLTDLAAIEEHLSVALQRARETHHRKHGIHSLSLEATLPGSSGRLVGSPALLSIPPAGKKSSVGTLHLALLASSEGEEGGYRLRFFTESLEGLAACSSVSEVHLRHQSDESSRILSRSFGPKTRESGNLWLINGTSNIAAMEASLAVSNCVATRYRWIGGGNLGLSARLLDAVVATHRGDPVLCILHEIQVNVGESQTALSFVSGITGDRVASLKIGGLRKAGGTGGLKVGASRLYFHVANTVGAVDMANLARAPVPSMCPFTWPKVHVTAIATDFYHRDHLLVGRSDGVLMTLQVKQPSKKGSTCRVLNEVALPVGRLTAIRQISRSVFLTAAQGIDGDVTLRFVSTRAAAKTGSPIFSIQEASGYKVTTDDTLESDPVMGIDLLRFPPPPVLGSQSEPPSRVVVANAKADGTGVSVYAVIADALQEMENPGKSRWFLVILRVAPVAAVLIGSGLFQYVRMKRVQRYSLEEGAFMTGHPSLRKAVIERSTKNEDTDEPAYQPAGALKYNEEKPSSESTERPRRRLGLAQGLGYLYTQRAAARAEMRRARRQQWNVDS